MKKRLLIICDAFPPDFAPRMGYLCKNLENSEWETTVITEKGNESHCNIHTPNTTIHAFKYLKSSKIAKLEWGVKFLFTLLFDYKSHWLVRKCNKIINKQSFDLILCSTYSTFPLYAAYLLAKAKKIPFIADLRDISEQYDMSSAQIHHLPSCFGIGKKIQFVIEKRMKKQRNAVLKKAAAVISVSPWHIDFLKQFNTNTHLIYNGFDETEFIPKIKKTHTFNISYTGKWLNESIQDPTLLFKAIEKIRNNTEVYKNIVINWYTNENCIPRLIKKTSQYDISDKTNINTYKKRSLIPEILQESSICLILSNKTTSTGPKGIMTTKFFEALGCERPILCVRSDESCLADAIKNTNAGIAASNVEDVESFILEKYAEWQEKGYTTQNINQEEKKNFSRQKQALQFIEIFNQTINAFHSHSNI